MILGKFKFDAEHIYVASVVIAMGLLLYANSDTMEFPDGSVVSLGIGKAFYIPCGIALLCSLFIKSAHDKFEKIVNILIVIACLSSLIHPPHSSNVLSWGLTRFIMGLLCFRKLHVVDPNLVVRYFALAAPIIILPHYVLTNPFGYGAYRYAGFYGDSNFLAIALNFLIVISYISIVKSREKIIKLVGVVSIVSAIPLILLGISRTGIAGLTLIMLVIALHIRKNNRRFFFISLFCIAILSGTIAVKFADTFQSIIVRFSNESESDKTSSDIRMRGIEGSLTVLSNKPELIPLGIGVGNTTATMAEYQKIGYRHQADLHSTYFAVLYEMGILGLVFYLSLFWQAFQLLYKKKHKLLLCLLITDMMSLLTLPGTFFMPGWILLFFTSNIRIDKVGLE